MSRYAAFLLLLAIVPWNLCTADSNDYQDEYDATEAPFDGTTKTTSIATPTTITTTTAETSTTTKAATTSTTPETTTSTTPETTTSTTPETTTSTTPETTTSTTPETTTSTTATSTTTQTTTDSNATTVTSAPTTAPNTTVTSTTPAPTTTPAPLPEPKSQLYQVKKDNSSDSCLLVQFGLRIGVHGIKYEEMNLDPNNTVINGSCAEDNSTMVIQAADGLFLSLTFHNDSKKFSLSALNATGTLSSGEAFSENNNSLSLWQASLGSSYMCNKEQTTNITTKLTIFTFNLQVQPFGVKGTLFSTAQECSLDDTSVLIPIVVGAALAGLILIVVIAYVIGRRKTYVGYQTL